MAQGDETPSSHAARETFRLPHPLTLALVTAIAFVHLAGLSGFPRPSADEGTWPFSVREYVLGGTWTHNMPTAPAYHVVYGAWFRLLGPELWAARLLSALLSLTSLGLLYRVVRRSGGSERAAWWSALLLGTCYSAVALHRTALVEPLLNLWLFLLFYFLLGRDGRSLAGVLLASALVFLTKLTAIALVPAVLLAWGLGKVWRVPGPTTRGVLAVLGGGSIALLIYAGLYVADPQQFEYGWRQKLHLGVGGMMPSPALDRGRPVGTGGLNLERPPGIKRPGADSSSTSPPQSSLDREPEPSANPLHFERFRLAPEQKLLYFRKIVGTEPFLVVLGISGLALLLLQRQCVLIASWALCYGLLLVVQRYLLDNYLSPMYPALAVAAASLLARMHERDTGPQVGRRRMTWAVVTVAFTVGLGLALLFRGIRGPRATILSAIDYVATHRAPGEAVVGSLVVLMQLPPPGIPYLQLDENRIPSCEVLAQHQVRWVIVDQREWSGFVTRRGRTFSAVDSALSRCGAVVKQAGQDRVYRIAGPPTDSTSDLPHRAPR